MASCSCTSGMVSKVGCSATSAMVGRAQVYGDLVLVGGLG
jgi:hypothetical protein